MLRRVIIAIIVILLIIIGFHFISQLYKKVVLHTTTKTVTQNEPVAYTQRSVDDPKLAAGKHAVAQKGQNGTKKVQYQITYKNGREIKRQTKAITVTKQPVEQVTSVGTRTPAAGAKENLMLLLFSTLVSVSVYWLIIGKQRLRAALLRA